MGPKLGRGSRQKPETANINTLSPQTRFDFNSQPKAIPRYTSFVTAILPAQCRLRWLLVQRYQPASLRATTFEKTTDAYMPLT